MRILVVGDVVGSSGRRERAAGSRRASMR